MLPFAADLAVSFRRMRRAPGSAVFAAAILALGVGAATALFALVRGIVLRPLPYADPGQLVVLVEDTSSAKGWPTSVGRLADYNTRGQSFAGGLAAMRGADAVLTGAGASQGAERLSGARVTGNTFAVLGFPAQRGRLLVESDEHPGAPPVMVISEGLWRRRFAGDETIVGQTLDIDGSKRTVVGIAPRGFAWPRATTEFWIPFVPTEAERDRAGMALRTVGRLRSGGTIAAANAELASVAAALDKEFPDTDLGIRPRLVPMLEDMLGSTGSALGLLQGAALLVLLVATANFSNLLLARGAAREGELAVRTALGSDRHSLVRLQLAEALSIGVVGALLGLGLGAVALRVALAAGASSLPRAEEVQIDWVVVTLATGAALLASVLAALVPAMLSAGRPSADALRGSGKGAGLQRRRRLLAKLVVVEIAAATALAAVSGLLLLSVASLAATESGVDTTGVVTLEIGQPAGVSATAELAVYHRRLVERLRETPGFDAVSAISRLPVVGLPASTSFQLEGPPNIPGQGPVADQRYVEPGALPLLAVPFLAGRDVLPTDDAGAPFVLLVNRAFVASHYPDGDAVGKRMWIANEKGRWRTIVGVVGDVHLADLERPVDPTVWIPFAQATFPGPLRSVSVLVKSRLAPGDALQRARTAIASFDALQAPTKPRPLAEAIEGSLAPRRFQAGLLAAFALIAGALAAAGVYGVTAYSVSQRRDEFGVRLALGANAGSLTRLVLGQGARLGGLGILAGILVALASGRFVVRWLYGVRSWDPPVLCLVVLLLSATALVASLLPALQAARTAPAVALRAMR